MFQKISSCLLLFNSEKQVIYIYWLNPVINDHLDIVSRNKRKKKAMSQ